jgi:hypothetical protein
MSKQFINYGTFLELASLLDPENYPGGSRKSPREIVTMIKMFDICLYRFNHGIDLYPVSLNSDEYVNVYTSPYDFCSDSRLSKDNLGFELEEYTKSLITKIKDENYILSISDLYTYELFTKHKINGWYNGTFWNVLEFFVISTATGIPSISKNTSIIGLYSRSVKTIDSNAYNCDLPQPHDCYYVGLSESNCVARLIQVNKNIDELCYKLDILNSMTNIDKEEFTKEYNSILRMIGNYTKIRNDLKKFKNTHNCLPKSKSRLEFEE